MSTGNVKCDANNYINRTLMKPRAGYVDVGERKMKEEAIATIKAKRRRTILVSGRHNAPVVEEPGIRSLNFKKIAVLNA